MRLSSVGCTALVVAVVGAAARAGAQAVRDTTLANGLQVTVIENHAVPLVTAVFVVRGGALAQDASTEGMVSLFVHTPTITRGADIRDLTALHGNYTSQISAEHTSHIVTVPPSQVDGGVKILAGIVDDANYNEADWSVGLIGFGTQLETTIEHPETLLRRAVGQRLWGPAWPQKDNLGLPQVVRRLESGFLTNFHRTYYVPNNAALVLSGDLTPSAGFLAARRAFDDWRRGPDPLLAHPALPVPPLAAPDAVVQTADVPDVTVLVDWQGPVPGHAPDLSYAADVFTSLFNDPASRFQRYLVESGLFQHLSISYITLSHTGPIEILGRTSPDSLTRAVTALKRELAAAALPGAIDDDALIGARRQRRVVIAQEFEQASVAASTYATWWADAGPDYLRSYGDHLDATTAADVRSYVTGYLARPYVIGILGPDKAYPALTMAAQTFASDTGTAPANAGVAK